MGIATNYLYSINPNYTFLRPNYLSYFPTNSNLFQIL